MCIVWLGIEKALFVDIEMHHCLSKKATASSHVLSPFVKNEECTETATSPFPKNATKDDNIVRQSLLGKMY